MDEKAWKDLRRKVQREYRDWNGPNNLNKPGRDLAAGMAGAYGGILRMMDKIEAEAKARG